MSSEKPKASRRRDEALEGIIMGGLTSYSSLHLAETSDGEEGIESIRTKTYGWLAGISDILAMFLSSYTEPIATADLIAILRSGQQRQTEIAAKHPKASEEQVFHAAYAFAYGYVASKMDPQSKPVTGP